MMTSADYNIIMEGVDFRINKLKKKIKKLEKEIKNDDNRSISKNKK